MPLDSNTRDVALDILDRALHPSTSDEEVVASIYAWRRKTGNALIREVLQPTTPTEAGQPAAAEIVWQSIQRRDVEINALRTRLAASKREAESFRRKVQVEIDRTIRTQQELEAARAKIADLEAASSGRRRWWTRS
jgi:hypothetical protein